MIYRFFIVIALAVPLTFGGFPTTTALAADNILIMAEDSSPQTLSRNEQLSQKILAGVSEGLITTGAHVYDETAITFQNYVQGRNRRSNEELIDIAASIRKPKIDLVVFLIADRFVKSGKYFDRASLNLSARIIDVQSGRVLGTTSFKPKPWSLKRGCAADSACVEEALQREPEKVGLALATKLIEILNRQ